MTEPAGISQNELIRKSLKKKSKKVHRKKRTVRIVITLVITAAIAYLLLGVVFGVAILKGTSMMPSVSSGSPLVYFRLDKSYLPGDVVVFETASGEVAVRRIVAASGDKVEIDNENGEIKINGIVEKNLNVVGDTYTYSDGEVFPLTVGDGEYFLLGDSREGSDDSRRYGCIKEDMILGRVVLEFKLFSR